MQSRDLDTTVRRLAAAQHALITPRQARGLGLNHDAVAHRVQRGDLERITPRVLRIAGAPDTPAQRLLTAVLDAGRHAALSHTTALAHWGVRGFRPDPVHVVRRRTVDDHPVTGATIHEVRFLPATEVRVLDGVPTVSPALALLQLAGMAVPNAQVGRAIDAAWSDRLVSYRALTLIDQTMSRQGRRGLRRFRELVEDRGPAYVPPASNLEARFAEILQRAGRPALQRQVDTSGEEGWIGRVDFRDLVLPVIVEVQSERFHRGLTAEAADRERLRALRAAGYVVVEVTDEEIFHRPAEVVARVDEARRLAAARQVA